MPLIHYSEKIKEARKTGDFQAAFERSKRLGKQDLDEALETVLATEAGDEATYDALAVRWILMATEAQKLSLYSVGWYSSRFIEHLVDYRDASVPLRRSIGPEDAPHPLDAKIADLDKAIAAGDLDEAWQRARSFARVSLDRVLRIILMLADLRDRRYEAACRRFLIRVLAEIAPDIEQIEKLTNCFAYIHHAYYGEFAWEALYDAVRQLARIEAREVDASLKISFDVAIP